MGATGVVGVLNRFVWGSFCGSGSFVTSLLLVVLGVIRYTLPGLAEACVKPAEGALCFAFRGDFF